MDHSILSNKIHTREPDLETSFVTCICVWLIVFQEGQMVLLLEKEMSLSGFFPCLTGLLVCAHMLLLWPIFAADLSLTIAPQPESKVPA